MKRIAALLITTAFMLGLFSGGAAMADGDKNLIAGKQAYSVVCGEPSEHGYMALGNETVGTEKLTDGVYSPTTKFSDPAYHAMYRCATREIVYELDEVSAVTGFKASFLCDVPAGVHIPRYVNLYVSENGEDYMLAYTVDGTAMNADTTLRKVAYSVTDGARYRAKYVKIEFDVIVNLRCDEIEVYGGKTDSTELAFVKDPEKEWANAYDTGIEGLQDMVLIHAGSSSGVDGNGNEVSYDSSYVNTTEEMFLPYIAYVDEKGEIKDTMFDSVLFLPLQGLTPSGGILYYCQGRPTIMSDWEYFANNMFSQTSNMRALDNTVATVKNALGLTDYKVKVTVALPYALKTTKAFGDIDGDGENEGCNTFEERKAIYEWYMRYVLDLFENGDYANLEFGGFYWNHESVVLAGGTEERELVGAVGETAHSFGTKFLWIPFYLAAGFEGWEDYGFDCAYMQPNYISLTAATHEMLGEFAATIKKHGMAMEMEIRWGAVNPSSDSYEDDISRYENYLRYGVYTGYMTESAHAYYQGANPGYLYTAAKSGSSRVRALYDNTYKFIKGTYTLSAPTLSGGDMNITEYGKKTYGYVKVRDDDTATGEVTVSVVRDAEHGVFAMSNSGDYSYMPDEGFTGIDTVVVRAFDGYYYSEEHTITLTVGNVAESGGTSAPADVSADESAPERKQGGLVAALVAAGVIAAAAVGYIVVKKKKSK